MFINAQPRRVVHGSKTFVHSGRAESVHQRLSLCDMTENQINAWSSVRPWVQPPRPKEQIWNSRETLLHQNFPAVSLDNPLQLPPYNHRAQFFDREAPVYFYANSVVPQEYNPTPFEHPGYPNLYQRNGAQENSTYKPNLMLGSSGSSNNPWPWKTPYDGQSCLAQDLNFQRLFPYHAMASPATHSCHSFTGSSPTLSAHNSFSMTTSSSNNSFSMATTSSQDNSFSMATSPPINSSGIPVSDTISSTRPFQPQCGTVVPNGNPDVNLDRMSCGVQEHPAGAGPMSSIPPSNHGFPESFQDSWFLDPGPVTNQPYVPTTISPKLLTLDAYSNILPTKGSELLNTEPDVVTREVPNPIRNTANLKWVQKRPRKALPSGKPQSLPNVPIVPSTKVHKVTKSRAGKLAKSKNPTLSSASKSECRTASANALAPISPTQDKRKSEATLDKIIAATTEKPAPKIEAPAPPPMTKPPIGEPTRGLTPDLIPKVNELKYQESRNRFLVNSKKAGKTYKWIREKGGFREAESTLRGRFRTLTKDPGERVRKPEWEDNDIKLLRKAVRKLNSGHYPRSGNVKVPWKRVAEYIAENGGSYLFGNATCRKKWDEIQKSGGGWNL